MNYKKLLDDFNADPRFKDNLHKILCADEVYCILFDYFHNEDEFNTLCDFVYKLYVRSDGDKPSDICNWVRHGLHIGSFTLKDVSENTRKVYKFCERYY